MGLEEQWGVGGERCSSVCHSGSKWETNQEGIGYSRAYTPEDDDGMIEDIHVYWKPLPLRG